MRHRIAKYLLTLSLLLIVASASAARQINSFSINYADPEQIRSVVRSYLSPGSSVSLYQNRLVVNATAEEIEKTRELLRQLDVGGRQLSISVKTDEQGSLQRQQASLAGRVEVGSGLQTNTRTRVTVENYTSNRNRVGGQGVRATEGLPVFISVGSTAPISAYRSTADGRLIQQHETISASSGFYATARIIDNKVRVSIDQQRQQLHGKLVQGQQLQSEISGALGAWLPVGMTSQTSTEDGSGILRRQSGSSHSSGTIYLKVELLN